MNTSNAETTPQTPANSPSSHLDALCALMQQVCGRAVRTPQDFDFLAASIFRRIHESVSASTLKRIFGYVKTDGNPRRAVLDILSRYVGYSDWDAFCRRSDADALIESNPILGEAVSADALCKGDLIAVSWQPDRECTFRCTGPHRFVVESSRGSKLSVGDTFVAHQFISGEPLYLENLCMQGSIPVNYVCGRDSGIRFRFTHK